MCVRVHLCVRMRVRVRVRVYVRVYVCVCVHTSLFKGFFERCIGVTRSHLSDTGLRMSRAGMYVCVCVCVCVCFRI